MSNASSLRKSILQTNDIPTENVTVPHWNDIEIQIRGLSGAGRSRLIKSAMVNGELDFDKLYPMLIVATVHDPESGEAIFTEADVEALNEKSSSSLEFVGKIAARLSGLDNKENEEVGKPSS